MKYTLSILFSLILSLSSQSILADGIPMYYSSFENVACSAVQDENHFVFIGEKIQDVYFNEDCNLSSCPSGYFIQYEIEEVLSGSFIPTANEFQLPDGEILELSNTATTIWLYTRSITHAQPSRALVSSIIESSEYIGYENVYTIIYDGNSVLAFNEATGLFEGNIYIASPPYAETQTFTTEECHQIVESCTLGSFSPELEIESINLYPNPASDWVQIPNAQNNIEINLFNIAGELILRESNSTRLDVANISPGIYFLLILNEDGSRAGSELVIR